MAQAAAEGAASAPDTEIELLQVPELMPPEALEKSGAALARKAFAHIPLARPEDLARADGIVFATPTRFGNISAQMRNFLDQTGPLWMKGALIGKPAAGIVSTATQHGGQESTLLGLITTLLHHGMIIVGLPYSEPNLSKVERVSGGSPYGASTIAGPDGKRQPSEEELQLARALGRRLAEVAARLKLAYHE
jgi:NAD(P)H dehydrogenase (quinone)